MKLVHVITGLEVGGAETFLARLLEGLPKDYELIVVSLSGEGAVASRIRAGGVPVLTLNMNRHRPSLIPLLRLVRILKDAQPDVVHTWMYHADLIGGLAAWIAGVQTIIWSIRQTQVKGKLLKRSTRAILRLCAALSRFVPTHILCCAEAAKRNHIAAGYQASKMTVIPNGFEVVRFSADGSVRRRMRQTLCIAEDAIVVAMIGRFTPAKAHGVFFSAAAKLAQTFPNIVFLLAGKNVDEQNPDIRLSLESGHLKGRVILLGARADVADLMRASDLLVSSSHTEGFPNVIGEAMACEVPCVGTNVGDTAMIIGDTGRVVPPNDPDALAEAVSELAVFPAGERMAMGAEARARIMANFEIGLIANRYKAFYETAVSYSK